MSVQDFGSQFALDLQGLQRLKHSARQDASSGVQGAAQQFEALFIQMMMKSMRDAVPTTGLLDSKQTEFYQSLLDQQWSQTLASRGMGLAESLVSQLESSGMVAARPSRGSDVDELIAGIPRGAPRVLENALRGDDRDADASARADAPANGTGDGAAAPESFMAALDASSRGFMAHLATASTPGAARSEPSTATAESTQATSRQARFRQATPPNHVQAFVERLAGPARAASRTTGVPAELILAQAALETGWGRHEIATNDGRNSHNLFGIKAGNHWQGPTAEITTHEYLDGRRTPMTDSFRVYDSFESAFTDYARLIGDNPRYARVTAAPDAAQAARELQAGGYATDPAYADKLIAVMDSLGPVASTNDSLVFLQY
ncbi:MAG TPA: flagellar assembly peptidoglycan hydrolase FlgJ [Halomonas sp.]|nr:flagellar assembly peptidoglycan hydrolase FlgJ [Halomonas sp.]